LSMLASPPATLALYLDTPNERTAVTACRISR